MRLSAGARRFVSAGLLIGCGWRHPAAARLLQVGEGQEYIVPSAAAAVARDGDAIAIAAGVYFDCAVWAASRLTIAGTAPDSVISDRACGGKAAFVITGNDVVVRGLVFQRVRVPDGNGAGIRVEGAGLTVTDCRFINNQVGILAGGETGALRITGSMFSANGASADGRPTHAVSAGRLDLLHIERSTFVAARGGDHISSAARVTELLDNLLVDEGGAMAGPLVTVTGGALSLQNNRVELAAGTTDREGAVLVYGEANAIVVRGNTLVEPAGSVPLLRNWTSVTPDQAANTVPAGVVAVSEQGSTYHRLRGRIAHARDLAHGILADARHQVAELARSLRMIP